MDSKLLRGMKELTPSEKVSISGGMVMPNLMHIYIPKDKIGPIKPWPGRKIYDLNIWS